MVDALVLSGGASHGDFEVGAVRRLFEAGFEPALIVSASVGSINGVKLSEMGALAVAGAPSGLEQIWLGLQNNSSMWTKNPDFDTSALTPLVTQLKATGLNLQEDYTWRIWAAAGAGAASGVVLGGPVGSLAGAALGLLIGIFQSGSDASALAAEAGTLMGAVQKIMQARSLYTLDPISKALFADINPATVKNSSIRLLMAVVSLESGDLRYVTNSGAVMQEDTTTPYSEQQSVSPNCQDDLGAYNDAVANLRETLGSRGDYSSYAEWHAAVLKAQAEVSTTKAALDACLRAHPRPTSQPVSTDVRTGVLASASIPMIFEPVKIGNDNYVDGGTRSQVPITGAIAAAKAAAPSDPITIWAIDCNYPGILPAVDPLTGTPVTNFDTANFLDIAGRATGDILPNQVALDNDAAADTASAAVTLVQPGMKDIHNGFTIDPGLILINIAHGYMRTDDTMLARVVYGDTAPATVDLISGPLSTFKIISLRYSIWYREHDVVGWAVNQDPDKTINPPIAPWTPPWTGKHWLTSGG